MNKLFTTIKVGYRSGVYGCIAEYFTTLVIYGDKHNSLSYGGLYGVQDRVGGALKRLGYEEFYTPSFYGRLTRSDLSKYILDETQAIKLINNGFNREAL